MISWSAPTVNGPTTWRTACSSGKSGKKLPRLPLIDRDAHRRQKTNMLARQTSEDERQQPFGLGIEPLRVIDGNQNRGRGSGRHDGVEHTC